MRAYKHVGSLDVLKVNPELAGPASLECMVAPIESSDILMDNLRLLSRRV